MTIKEAIDRLTAFDADRTTAGPDSDLAAAVRMGAQALALLYWIPVSERKPETNEFVLGVCTAQLSEHAFLTDAISIVEYDEYADQWLLDAWPEVEDVRVSHWMPLPLPPGEDE